ncbi:hypothetical protein ACFOGI_11950, partial [Virgibacillus xinjiangensis]
LLEKTSCFFLTYWLFCSVFKEQIVSVVFEATFILYQLGISLSTTFLSYFISKAEVVAPLNGDLNNISCFSSKSQQLILFFVADNAFCRFLSEQRYLIYHVSFDKASLF